MLRSPDLQGGRFEFDWSRQKCAWYYNIRTECGQGTVAETELDHFSTVTTTRDVKKTARRSRKCKSRARTAIYWPRINAGIGKMVSTCETCLMHCAKQQKEPIIIDDSPDELWQKVRTDMFFLNGWRLHCFPIHLLLVWQNT